MEIKRYLIWRHDYAIGNTAEQVIGLTQHLLKTKARPVEIEVFVEKPWQRTLAQSSPQLADAKFSFVEDGALLINDESVAVPNVYREKNSYPAGWANLDHETANCLRVPSETQSEFDVVFMFKSRAHKHPGETRNHDAHRFVSESKYHQIVLELARQGHRVARIGGPEQEMIAPHANVTDFRGKDSSMSLDLKLLAASKLNVFTDSGLWPISVGLGKSTLVSDVVSDLGSFRTWRYLPFVGIRVGRKKTPVFDWTSSTDTKLLRKKSLRIGPLHVFFPVGKRRIVSEILALLDARLSTEA